MAGNNGAKNNSIEHCEICKDGVEYTSRHLTIHIQRDHGLDKVAYITKYILNGEIPACQCGCGEPVKVHTYKPYIIRKFVAGHHARGEFNPMHGKTFTGETKHKMHVSARRRIEAHDGRLPMHSPSALQKRGRAFSDRYMSKKCQESGVTFTNTYQDRQNGVYQFKCDTCDSPFTQYHNSYFLCTHCNPRIKSKPEMELYVFLTEELNLVVKHGDRYAIKPYELDMYIPTLNVGIEFNGLYYHSQKGGNKDRNYHAHKSELARSVGIRLIHVMEDEWRDAPDLIKAKLSHILGQSTLPKIYARKCNVKPITPTLKNEFLRKNHIQGPDKSSVKLGCFYGDELVSVMTFGSPSVSKGGKSGENMYELVRFASNIDFVVIGAAGKLLSYFIKHYGPNEIISYADLRWVTEDSNVYKSLGFKLISRSAPNYWYMQNYRHRFHRYNFTKHKLVKSGASPDKTEWAIMQERGYDRIWDCGNLKYNLVV